VCCIQSLEIKCHFISEISIHSDDNNFSVFLDNEFISSFVDFLFHNDLFNSTIASSGILSKSEDILIFLPLFEIVSFQS